MTKQTRRKFTADFKAKVALEAIKNQKTLAELSQHFEVNSVVFTYQRRNFGIAGRFIIMGEVKSIFVHVLHINRMCPVKD